MRRARRERIARFFARLVPWIGVAAPLLVAGLATSRAGGRWLSQRLVAAVNASIPGRLTVGTLRLGTDLSLHATGVRIAAPDGADAIAIRDLTIVFDARSLSGDVPAIALDADGVEVDLSPDASGRPALLRALVSTRAGGPSRAAPVFALEATLKNARVVRRAAVESGSVFDAADVGAIDLAARLESSGPAWNLVADALGTVRSPATRILALHGSLSTTAAGTAFPVVRIVFGRTRLSADAVVLANDVERSGGRLVLHAAPEDLVLFAGVRPEGALALTAAAGPVDGRLVGAWSASIANGGTISGAVAREADGTLRGSAALARVAPERWVGSAFPAGRLDGALAFARAPDARLAARVLTFSGTAGRARVRDAQLDVAHTPDGTTVGTLRRLRADDPIGGRWVLRSPARVTLRDGELDVENLALRGPRGAEIFADGHWPPRPAHPFLATARAIELPGLLGELVPAVAEAGGIVSAHARFESTPTRPAPTGRAWLRWRDARWRKAGPGELLVTAIAAKGRVALAVDGTGPGDEHLRLDADAPLFWPRASDHAELRASMRGARVRDLHDVAGTLVAGFARGQGWATLDLTSPSATLARLAASADVDWARLRRTGIRRALEQPPPFAVTIDELRLASLAEAGLLPEKAAGDVTGMIAASHGRTHLRLFANEARLGAVESLAVTLAGTAEATRVRLVGRAAAPSGGGASLAAYADASRGLWSPRGFAWRARAVASSLPIAPSAAGLVDGAFALEGHGAEARGWTYARTHGLTLSGEELGEVALAARAGERATVVSLSGRVPEGGRLAAFVRVEGTPDGFLDGAWRRSPLLIAALADGAPLAPFSALLPENVSVGGRADLRAIVRGTADEPDPRARLYVRDGTLVHPDVGRVTAIVIDADIDRRHLEISRLEARSGGTLSGSARAVNESGAWSLDGAIDARRFGIDGDKFAAALDVRATVGAGLAGSRLVAEVRVDSGTVWLPATPAKSVQSLAPNPDFVILVPDQPEVLRVRGVARARSGLEARIHLLAPRNFWIKGEDVDGELRGDVTVRTAPDLDEPRLDGDVEALRGAAAVAGKRFTVQRARLLFPGGPLDEARLDILAEHDLEDVDRTKIYAAVTGTVARPRVVLRSEPDLPQNAIASLLFLGSTDPRARPSAAQGPSLAGRAATFVGNYLTAQVRQQLTAVIPVDVLELQPGAAGSSASGRVRVGKYVAPGLFLSYAHSFGASPDEGSNAFQLEYRFERVWQLLGEFTDRNRGSVDLVWSHDF